MTKCMLFTQKMFVFQNCFIFIVLESDTSSQRSIGGQPKSSRHSVKGKRQHVCKGRMGNLTLSKT